MLCTTELGTVRFGSRGDCPGIPARWRFQLSYVPIGRFLIPDLDSCSSVYIDLINSHTVRAGSPRTGLASPYLSVSFSRELHECSSARLVLRSFSCRRQITKSELYRSARKITSRDDQEHSKPFATPHHAIDVLGVLPPGPIHSVSGLCVGVKLDIKCAPPRDISLSSRTT